MADDNKITYILEHTDYINKAFDRLPNGIINKGRCGNGGTTLELNDSRNSIIIVPNISIIKNKKKVFPDLLEVYGNTSETDIAEYIKNKDGHIKIMSTPDSFYKIIDASKKLDYDIYKNCFLLVDEYHSAITEAGYREIYKVFDYFFDFRDKAAISATPISFSDFRFTQLQEHEISFLQPVKKEINIVFTQNVGHTFNTLAKYVKNDGTNLHVFYNTVEGIARMIDLVGVEGVAVYCANNADNIGKLGDYANLLRDVNDIDYKADKINFYTTKYYEGWDLFDEDATIVLLTDIYNPNTCLDIKTKGIQAIGRLRNSAPKAIYHITDIKYSEEEMRNYDDIKNEKVELANDFVMGFNTLNDVLSKLNMRTEAHASFYRSLSTHVASFGDISSTDGTAVVNYFKVDNAIFNDIAVEQFLNKKTLKDAWTNAGFKVAILEDNSSLSKEERDILKSQKTSRAEKNKVIYGKFNSLIPRGTLLVPIKTGNSTRIFFGTRETDKLIETYPRHYERYEVLGYDKIEELGFNDKMINEAYILEKANKMEVSVELGKLIYQEFNTYTFYSSSKIKDILKEVYLKLGVDKPITANYIKKYYSAEVRIKKLNGDTVRGYFLRNRLRNI